MRSGLISIVTPALNAEKYLRQTMESIFSQTYPDWEYLIVDGGSTDATRQIVESFGNRARLIVMDASQARAVNIGFENSVGEYFAFLNADDVLMPSAFSECVAALQGRSDACYAYGGAMLVDEDGVPIKPYPVEEVSRDALMRNCVICQPATLLRSEAFARFGGLAENYHTAFDYDLWVRMEESHCHGVRINSDLAHARIHKDAKTMKQRGVVFADVFHLLEEHFRYVPFNWAHGYAGFILHGSDDISIMPKGSILRTLITCFIGLSKNWRHPFRFLTEYVSETFRLRREARSKSTS